MGDESKESVSDAANHAEEDPDFPIDFTTFTLSLRSTAAFHLGLAPHPEHQNSCENLPKAKQTIDILARLQEKTMGNLSGEEERMLADTIYSLRMAYLQLSTECGCSDSED